jgi:hypothetical protein
LDVLEMYPEFAESFCKHLVINYNLRDESQAKNRRPIMFERQKLMRMSSTGQNRENQCEGRTEMKNNNIINEPLFADVRAFSSQFRPTIGAAEDFGIHSGQQPQQQQSQPPQTFNNSLGKYFFILY